jgi:hypothetical protein
MFAWQQVVDPLHHAFPIEQQVKGDNRGNEQDGDRVEHAEPALCQGRRKAADQFDGAGDKIAEAALKLSRPLHAEPLGELGCILDRKPLQVPDIAGKPGNQADDLLADQRHEHQEQPDDEREDEE